jgi:hypothetical protein
MSIAGARSGQNAEIERREAERERDMKSPFEFSQKEHRSKLR